MATATPATLLASPPPALRAPGRGGRAPAPEGHCWLAAAFAAAAEAPPVGTSALPRPQLQIRSFSGGRARVAAPGGGWLASPTGVPTPAAGPLSTSNYLRLSFEAPLPAAVLAAQPEIWLFTPAGPRRRPAPAQPPGLLALAGWHHPGPGPAPTALGGAALRRGLAGPRPGATIVLDPNHWLRAGPQREARFRFALAVPDEAAPAGWRLGPLSAEVGLGGGRQQAFTTCAFRVPVCPRLVPVAALTTSSITLPVNWASSTMGGPLAPAARLGADSS